LELARARDLELNEVNWWSRWADVHWTGEASYIMLSSEFDEYFFNRAGFVDCPGGTDDILRIEKEFKALAKPTCFSVQEECWEIAAILKSRGYIKFDSMAVMQLDRPDFKTAVGLTVLSGQEISTAKWAAAYSRSFYGGLGMQESVSLIADRLNMEPSVTLLLGEKDGKTSGVLAAFRTPGLLGVYCVGTLGEHRNMGVAGSLIQEASRLASKEGRLLILQTMASEKAEAFYTRGGFRRLYLKQLVRHGGDSESHWNPRRRQ
jgi:GNAT superfamily N-acetyltransferase